MKPEEKVTVKDLAICVQRVVNSYDILHHCLFDYEKVTAVIELVRLGSTRNQQGMSEIDHEVKKLLAAWVRGALFEAKVFYGNFVKLKNAWKSLEKYAVNDLNATAPRGNPVMVQLETRTVEAACRLWSAVKLTEAVGESSVSNMVSSPEVMSVCSAMSSLLHSVGELQAFKKRLVETGEVKAV